MNLPNREERERPRRDRVQRVRAIKPQWEDDHQLLHDLAHAVRAVDGLSEWIGQLGTEAFSRHDVEIELELAALMYDSALESDVVARQGRAADHRMLLFEGTSGSVQIEKAGDQVIGQLIPPESGPVWAVSCDGTVARADVDEMGFFSFEVLPDEPLRLRWQTATATLVSDWFRL